MNLCQVVLSHFYTETDLNGYSYPLVLIRGYFVFFFLQMQRIRQSKLYPLILEKEIQNKKNTWLVYHYHDMTMDVRPLLQLGDKWTDLQQF